MNKEIIMSTGDEDHIDQLARDTQFTKEQLSMIAKNIPLLDAHQISWLYHLWKKSNWDLDRFTRCITVEGGFEIMMAGNLHNQKKEKRPYYIFHRDYF
jgi:hypothetical protein